jgi:Domain of unknown function (DUF397)
MYTILYIQAYITAMVNTKRRVTRDTWRRATGCVGGDCVEVRHTNARVEVRDSKNPTGAVLTFDPDAWMDFLAELRDGGYGVPPHRSPQ